MSPLRLAYLALAILGAVVPAASGVGAPPAVADPAAWTGLGAFALWVIAECLVRDDRLSLATLPAAALLGLGCGLPLYLFLRTRRMERD